MIDPVSPTSPTTDLGSAAADAESGSVSITRVVAVTGGIFLLCAAAGYVVGAAASRIVDDGPGFTEVLTILVICVLLVAFASDRVRSAIARRRPG